MEHSNGVEQTVPGNITQMVHSQPQVQSVPSVLQMRQTNQPVLQPRHTGILYMGSQRQVNQPSLQMRQKNQTTLQTRQVNQSTIQLKLVNQPIIQVRQINQPTLQTRQLNQSTLQLKVVNQPIIQLTQINQPTLQTRQVNQPISQLRQINQQTVQTRQVNQATLQTRQVNQPTLQSQHVYQPISQVRQVNQPISQVRQVNQPTLQSQQVYQPISQLRQVDQQCLQLRHIIRPTLQTRQINQQSLQLRQINPSTLQTRHTHQPTLQTRQIDQQTLQGQIPTSKSVSNQTLVSESNMYLLDKDIKTEPIENITGLDSLTAIVKSEPQETTGENQNPIPQCVVVTFCKKSLEQPNVEDDIKTELSDIHIQEHMETDVNNTPGAFVGKNKVKKDSVNMTENVEFTNMVENIDEIKTEDFESTSVIETTDEVKTEDVESTSVIEAIDEVKTEDVEAIRVIEAIDEVKTEDVEATSVIEAIDEVKTENVEATSVIENEVKTEHVEATNVIENIDEVEIDDVEASSVLENIDEVKTDVDTTSVIENIDEEKTDVDATSVIENINEVKTDVDATSVIENTNGVKTDVDATSVIENIDEVKTDVDTTSVIENIDEVKSNVDATNLIENTDEVNTESVNVTCFYSSGLDCESKTENVEFTSTHTAQSKTGNIEITDQQRYINSIKPCDTSIFSQNDIEDNNRIRKKLETRNNFISENENTTDPSEESDRNTGSLISKPGYSAKLSDKDTGFMNKPNSLSSAAKSGCTWNPIGNSDTSSMNVNTSSTINTGKTAVENQNKEVSALKPISLWAHDNVAATRQPLPKISVAGKSYSESEKQGIQYYTKLGQLLLKNIHNSKKESSVDQNILSNISLSDSYVFKGQWNKKPVKITLLNPNVNVPTLPVPIVTQKSTVSQIPSVTPISSVTQISSASQIPSASPISSVTQIPSVTLLSSVTQISSASQIPSAVSVPSLSSATPLTHLTSISSVAPMISATTVSLVTPMSSVTTSISLATPIISATTVSSVTSAFHQTMSSQILTKEIPTVEKTLAVRLPIRNDINARSKISLSDNLDMNDHSNLNKQAAVRHEDVNFNSPSLSVSHMEGSPNPDSFVKHNPLQLATAVQSSPISVDQSSNMNTQVRSNQTLKSMTSFSDKFHQCNLCCFFFRTAHAFIKHNKMYHDNIAPSLNFSDTKFYQCGICNDNKYAFNSSSLLGKHMKSFHNDYVVQKRIRDKKRKGEEKHSENSTSKRQKQTPLDEERMEKEQCLKDIMEKQRKRVTKKNFTCSICRSTFTSQTIYSRHRRMHLPIKYTNRYLRTMLCHICGKYLISEKISKFVHICSCLRQCSQCRKVFDNIVDYRSHVKSHTRKQPFPCILCSCSFAKKSSLEKHVRDHGKTKHALCPYCGKFVPSSYMSIHIKYHVHPFKCSICGKSFPVISRYKDHLLSHSGEYTCDTCGQSKSTYSGLVGHVTRHFAEKLYSCEVCNMNFSFFSELLSHMKSIRHRDQFVIKNTNKTIP